MKKKTVSLLLVAAMAVGMLAGCGGGKSSISQDGSSDAAEGNEKAEMADAKDVDGTTITFWHSMGGVNGQAIDTLVKKFNDENEYGITVEAQYQGEYDDSLNKLKSAQIGNMGADLVQVYEIGTRFMIESGWTVPMQEMIDADNYDVSEIEPNLAAYYTIDNQLYSIACILNLNIKKISRLFDNFIKRLGKTVRNSKNIYCLYQQNLAKKENCFY